MPRWDHTIKIKDLFEQDAKDHNEVASRIAPIAAARVKALASRIALREPFLSDDLEGIAEDLEDAAKAESPQEAFNDALSHLYDLGDANRIWIG